MHKIKALDDRSLKERGLGERGTTWTEERQAIDDGDLTTVAVRSGYG